MGVPTLYQQDHLPFYVLHFIVKSIYNTFFTYKTNNPTNPKWHLGKPQAFPSLNSKNLETDSDLQGHIRLNTLRGQEGRRRRKEVSGCYTINHHPQFTIAQIQSHLSKPQQSITFAANIIISYSICSTIHPSSCSSTRKRELQIITIFTKWLINIWVQGGWLSNMMFVG